MARWPARALPHPGLAVLLLVGCATATDSKGAYETPPPRKAAYVAECQRLGGRIVSRFCYTEGAGGPVLIYIPESLDRD